MIAEEEENYSCVAIVSAAYKHPQLATIVYPEVQRYVRAFDFPFDGVWVANWSREERHTALGIFAAAWRDFK